MNPNSFEHHLSEQPWRPIPPGWREEILAQVTADQAASDPDTVPARTMPSWLREWFWPHPTAWAALAACWLAILALDRLAAPSAAEVAHARSGARIAEALFAASRNPQALELTTQPVSTPAIDRPRRGPTDQGRIKHPFNALNA
jgi:hypothetical protein